MIDSILLIVWKINGSKVVQFAVYRYAIVQIVKLAPLYLLNHQEYWIGHEEKNYSEWYFKWDKSSEIVFCMFWKSIICQPWKISTEIRGGQIRAASTDLNNSLSGIRDLNKRIPLIFLDKRCEWKVTALTDYQMCIRSFYREKECTSKRRLYYIFWYFFLVWKSDIKMWHTCDAPGYREHVGQHGRTYVRTSCTVTPEWISKTLFKIEIFRPCANFRFSLTYLISMVSEMFWDTYIRKLWLYLTVEIF